GHDKHAGHSVDMFRQKFWGTLLLSIPTAIWGPMIQHWFGYQAPGGPLATRWIPAVFGTLVFGYGGWVFIRGAAQEIRDRLPGMMTLISLAITVAFGFSLAVTFGFPGFGSLVGTRDVGDDYGARPLGRDALDLPGAGRAQGTGET